MKKNNLLANDYIHEECQEQEIELVTGLIVTAEEVAALSLVEEKREREAIANLKKRTSFTADKIKLRESMRALENIETIGTILNDKEILERVAENINTAQDLKFLSDFRTAEIKNYQNLRRLDSGDAQGTAVMARCSLAIDNGQGQGLNVIVSANSTELD